ncbi:LacI family DNA-binding transcriptional regulator [Demequina sp. SO4-13]|uniref:LacI family DNA-binding transcriptional regulator n=1 Tax=Demequina sp. SO4-13 TaxID=3401027 RepID=UPI003AF59857
MHDVAARAGVSHQTVSRVINEFEGIRPATRERVLAAIEELGYHRNLSARALVTGRTHTIGMIGPLIPDIGPLSTLHAIERSARGVGLHTLMTSADATSESATEAVGFLLGRGVDAIALVAQQQAIADAVAAMRMDVPVIHLLTGGEPRGEAASIDQRAGVRLALDHLIDLGHTRIQHVSGPPTYTESQLRRDEYLKVVAERQLASLDILDGNWTADAGYAAGGRLDPTATAVFCANDQMAFGLIHALADAGKAVPHDVSVVGFDDTSEARHSLPPLTTVRQDFVAVGHLAVDLIVRAFDGADTSETKQLLPELVVRQTTGTPRI